jgi:hypothetical protein
MELLLLDLGTGRDELWRWLGALGFDDAVEALTVLEDHW